MAITHTLMHLFVHLRETGRLGAGRCRSMLDLGEQNWYGDADPAEIHGLIDRYQPDGRGAPMHAELDALLAARDPDLWAIARVFFRAVVEYDLYRAIDLNGTEIAERHDLNEPLPIDAQFDLVANLGTAEHIFNQAQLFRSIHERTRPGGMMVHWLPNQGCYDHGFFNYHPTFVHDLATANRYELLELFHADGTHAPAVARSIPGRLHYVQLALDGTLSDYSHLFALLRKAPQEAPFRMPQQGYYDSKLPADVAEAWQRLPR